ncbi:MAG: methyltransferase domain-containing protein [Candidatus Shapirobacteria bacterium]|nr:methyltransferase domain-containing protein [Candidatus Shapirobacteria bacterium]
MRIFKISGIVNKKEIFVLKKTISEQSFTYKPLFRELKKYIKKNSMILDAGCGEGNISLILAKKNNNITGIDISKKAINTAKKKAKILGLEKRTKFFVRDIHNFKLKEKFDFVVCVEVLEHIENDSQTIKNISNHIKKFGLLIITTPSKNAPLYRLKNVKEYDKKIGHIRRYYEKDLINKLEKNDLEILEIKKTEGVLRNFLFFTHFGKFLLKVVNRFFLISIIFEKIDDLLLKLFKESQITIIAKKK